MSSALTTSCRVALRAQCRLISSTVNASKQRTAGPEQQVSPLARRAVPRPFPVVDCSRGNFHLPTRSWQGKSRSMSTAALAIEEPVAEVSVQPESFDLINEEMVWYGNESTASMALRRAHLRQAFKYSHVRHMTTTSAPSCITREDMDWCTTLTLSPADRVAKSSSADKQDYGAEDFDWYHN